MGKEKEKPVLPKEEPIKTRELRSSKVILSSATKDKGNKNNKDK